MKRPIKSLILENITLPVQKYYVTIVIEQRVSFRYTDTHKYICVIICRIGKQNIARQKRENCINAVISKEANTISKEANTISKEAPKDVS